MSKELYRSRLFNIILLLLFAFLFFGGLYIARDFLIPISFAALLSMLLSPVVNKFESWKIPKSVSILLSLLIMFLILGLVVTLLSAQIVGFKDDLPIIKDNLTEKIDKFQHFVHDQTGVAPEKQMSIMKKRLSGMVDIGSTYAQKIFTGTTSTIASGGLMVIYSFFFLFYRTRFVNFILKITPSKEEEKTKNVISQISKVTQNYLSGVFTVMFILAVLNIIGLLIVGVKHAIFFAILAAMLNIIPYFGPFIGGLIPIVYVLITQDSLGFVVATASVFLTTQFLENNFFTPLIVGAKVKVNPLSTMLVLLVGSYIWGVAGMILFIPFLGVTKIIFDNVESLEPYGYLIGEDENSENNSENIFKRLYRKIKSKKD
jgi:predicted PurR-regulated permease PerM